MKLFMCQSCGQHLYFETVAYTRCGHTLGFLPDRPYAQGDFQAILNHWLPLAFAMNSLNRSMGHEDAYPFVLAPPVIEKLRLVHRIVKDPRTIA